MSAASQIPGSLDESFFPSVKGFGCGLSKRVSTKNSKLFRSEISQRILGMRTSLVRFAGSLCRDRDTAEDIAHDAILKAELAIDSFVETRETSLKNWLFMIVMNCYRSHLRRKKTEKEQDAIWLFDGDCYEQDFEAGYDSLPVVERLESLSQAHREAIFAFVNNRSYEEAAASIGINVGTLKSRLSRARNFLLADWMQPRKDARRARLGVRFDAYKSMNRALRAGVLVRPKHCEKCSAVGRIVGHHHDYAQPLSVAWLCPACHRDQHKKKRLTSKNTMPTTVPLEAA